jgi:UDP-2,3-diacylglucosamine pyrophosphatase LpxH
MRRLVQIILLKPILWASKKFASRPQRERIFKALTELLRNIQESAGKKGITLQFDADSRFIIFSDQHRGAKNGADDFAVAEPNYLAALDYYYKNDFNFISLGDSEELWENSLTRVKKYNVLSFEAEKNFIQHKRFYKIFGNHDLYWVNDPLAWWQLKKMYGEEVKVYEGILLRSTVYSQQPTANNPELATHHSPFTVLLTHGHQGDASSDGNWFSKFFVARIWAPLQSYLKINPNTPAYDEDMKTEHNHIMYEWAAEQSCLILITGHTHQPVFASLTHLERLYKQLQKAAGNIAEVDKLEAEIKRRDKKFKTDYPLIPELKPSYFNSGCCCFSDGDCTGIEISNGKISLIKWSKENGRELLEQTSFAELIPRLH